MQSMVNGSFAIIVMLACFSLCVCTSILAGEPYSVTASNC